MSAIKDLHYYAELLRSQGKPTIADGIVEAAIDLTARVAELQFEKDELHELLEEVLPTAESYLCICPDRHGKTIALFARAREVLGKQDSSVNRVAELEAERNRVSGLADQWRAKCQKMEARVAQETFQQVAVSDDFTAIYGTTRSE